MFPRLSLLLLFLAPLTQAVDVHYNVLSSALTSERELRELHLAAHVPYHSSLIPAFNDPEFLCKSLGLECLAVTYYDDIQSILGNATRDDFSGKQIELDDLIGREDETDHTCPIHWSDSRWGCPYAKALRKVEAYNVNQMRNRSDSVFENPTNSEKIFLRYPKSFRLFPKLLTQARTSRNSDREKVIEQSIKDALLISLSTVLATADYRNPTYPFSDQLVSKASLLQVSVLYRRLSGLGLWPELVDLTPDERADLGGIYKDKVEGTDRWLVKGFYDEKKNVIKMDLMNDFYENLFVYFHELWHVAWSHSARDKQEISKILEILAQPESQENKLSLRSSVLSYLSANEFFAIDQQIRLFRAVGFEAEDWDGQPLSSALAWHDSYMGPESYGVEIPPSVRKNKQGSIGDWGNGFIDLLTIGPNALVSKYRKDAANEANQQINSFSKKLDSTYWQGRMAAHAKFFEQKYFGEALGITQDIVPVAPSELLGGDFGAPFVPSLSCEQVRRIRESLGKNWEFGFPFHYVSSGNEQCSAEGGSDPIHPGHEGSHGGIDGFPALDGATLQGDGKHVSLSNPQHPLLRKPASGSCLDPDLAGFIIALLNDFQNSSGNGCLAGRGYALHGIESRIADIQEQISAALGSNDAFVQKISETFASCKASTCKADEIDSYSYGKACVKTKAIEIQAAVKALTCEN